jgi:hypothetical protein
MLTIQNEFLIRNRRLDKKGFYVFDILCDPEEYIFVISDGLLYKKVFLNRNKNGITDQYQLRCDDTQLAFYLEKAQIQNIDILLDKIRYIGIN